MDELWSKAQTTGEILNRSGTIFNPAIDKDLAMRDAETRLQTGGGLLGKGGISMSGILGGNDQENKPSTGVIAMSVNPFLWKGALETIDFMPLASANYSGGIIITDWYSENQSPNESIKISIRFLTNEVRSDAKAAVGDEYDTVLVGSLVKNMEGHVVCINV